MFLIVTLKFTDTPIGDQKKEPKEKKKTHIRVKSDRIVTTSRQKQISGSTDSLQGEKSSLAIMERLKTFSKMLGGTKIEGRRLSKQEKEQLEYINKLYYKIGPTLREDQLSETDKAIIRLKKIFDQEVMHVKPKPVAHYKSKSSLDISTPLLTSVMSNSKLEEISRNPQIKMAKPQNKSGLIRNEAFFASCSFTEQNRSKSMDDIYFLNEKKVSNTFHRANTMENLAIEDDIVLRPVNSRLKVNLTEGTYRFTKKNVPDDGSEARETFVQSLGAHAAFDFEETDSFLFEKPKKVCCENLEELYSKIDPSVPEEQLTKEEKFVVRLKKSLDEMGRKNTLKRNARLVRSRLDISRPTEESVLKNKPLVNIMNNPEIQDVEIKPEEPKKSFFEKIKYKNKKKTEDIVDAVNENVVTVNTNETKQLQIQEETCEAELPKIEEFNPETTTSNVEEDGLPKTSSVTSLYESVILNSPLYKFINERNAIPLVQKSISADTIPLSNESSNEIESVEVTDNLKSNEIKSEFKNTEDILPSAFSVTPIMVVEEIQVVHDITKQVESVVEDLKINEHIENEPDVNKDINEAVVPKVEVKLVPERFESVVYDVKVNENIENEAEINAGVNETVVAKIEQKIVPEIEQIVHCELDKTNNLPAIVEESLQIDENVAVEETKLPRVLSGTQKRKEKEKSSKPKPEETTQEQLLQNLEKHNLNPDEMSLILSYTQSPDFIVPSSPVTREEMRYIERARKEYPITDVDEEPVYENFMFLRRNESKSDRDRPLSFEYKKPVPLPRKHYEIEDKEVENGSNEENIVYLKEDEEEKIQEEELTNVCEKDKEDNETEPSFDVTQNSDSCDTAPEIEKYYSLEENDDKETEELKTSIKVEENNEHSENEDIFWEMPQCTKHFDSSNKIDSETDKEFAPQENDLTTEITKANQEEIDKENMESKSSKELSTIIGDLNKDEDVSATSDERMLGILENFLASERIASTSDSNNSATKIVELNDEDSSDESLKLRKTPKFFTRDTDMSDNKKEQPPTATGETSDPIAAKIAQTFPKVDSFDRSYLNLFKSPEQKTYEDITGTAPRPTTKGYINIHFLDSSDGSDGSDASIAKIIEEKCVEQEEQPIDYVSLEPSPEKKKSFEKTEQNKPTKINHDKHLDKCELERKSPGTSSSSRDSVNLSRLSLGSRSSFEAARKKFEAGSRPQSSQPGLDFANFKEPIRKKKSQLEKSVSDHLPDKNMKLE